MFEMTLSRANTFYNIANAALVLGAMLVLLGTIVAIWTGGIKERFGDERLSNNETETARANESAAAARERAALLEHNLLAERRLTANERWRLE